VVTFDQRVVSQLWERFMSGIEDDNFSQLRPEVRESWLRSKAYGLRPEKNKAPRVLEDDVLTQLRSESTLAQVCSPILNFTFDALRDLPNVLLLVADAQGRILEYVAGPRAQSAAEEINAISGACWTEELMGTDSLACCLRIQHPISIVGFEHYIQVGQNWAGHAAPIKDLFSNRLAGVVCIYGFQEEAHAKAKALVANCAHLIERSLHSKTATARLLVYENYASVRDRFKSEACLAITADSLLLRASPEASKLLGIPVVSPHSLSSLAEMNLVSPDTMLSRAMETIALRGRGGFTGTAQLFPVVDAGHTAGYIAVVDRLQRQAATDTMWKPGYAFADIVGTSDPLTSSLKRAERIAHTDDAVLITGESGTGKEMFAQAIHNAGIRRSKPFIPVNCGAMSDELLGAELFGYVEGAFTGATRRGRQGKFRSAHGGTLFLDEVEAMSPRMQSHLLRILEEKRVFPVGSEIPFEADVRILAATNVDLMKKIHDGSFRRDLYYRLSNQLLELPPLRLRCTDIPVLVAHFLKDTGTDISGSALGRLASHCWPGNVRELRNVLSQAKGMMTGTTISELDLPEYVCSSVCSSCQFGILAAQKEPAETKTLLMESERSAILEALRASDDNMSRAATMLGVSRVTLYRKLKKHQIRSDYS
jgi:sigma-54 dependent transcriptional regulator, acetoin dehydrogenase operon transcriptional activator AcoR